MRKKFLNISLLGLAVGFAICALFTAGVPMMLFQLFRGPLGIKFFIILLALRIVATMLHNRTKIINALTYPLAFLLGTVEGAMSCMILFQLVLLSFSFPKILAIASLISLFVLVGACAYMLFKFKKPLLVYMLTTYTFLILLGYVTTLDIRNALKPYVLRKCQALNEKGLKKIFTYPDCLTTKNKNECERLFGAGAPYDVFYHEPTEKLLVTGRDSGVLLIFSKEGELTKTVEIGGSPRFITYDKHRDVFYIATRYTERLFEFDPKTDILKDSPILTKAPYQKGCFLQNGDIMLYTYDNITIISAYDFKMSKNRYFRLPTFFISFIYDVECIDSKAIISFALHTPILREGLWMLDANDGFNPVHIKGLLFPVFEVVSDDSLLYVASPIKSSILIFSADDLKPMKTYKTVKGVRALEIDRENKKIYAGSFVEGNIEKVDILTGRVEKGWNIGPYLRNIHYAKSLKKVFATSQCGLFELVDE